MAGNRKAPLEVREAIDRIAELQLGRTSTFWIDVRSVLLDVYFAGMRKGATEAKHLTRTFYPSNLGCWELSKRLRSEAIASKKEFRDGR